MGLPALKRLIAALYAIALTSSGVSAASPPARIEARSQDLLAVALIRDDRMSIHLSRLMDNAPVHDAVVTVLLRGKSYPTTAETDGSYSLQSEALSLPGSAAFELQIAQASGPETLKSTLKIADAPARSADKSSARQLWWWVLNFAVCIGFLMLISRRRKSVQD